jgi:hypothetical protein
MQEIFTGVVGELTAEVFKVLIPLAAAGLVALIGMGIKRLGLTLSAENEAKLQAKMIQVLLAIEEMGRRHNKIPTPAIALSKRDLTIELARRDSDLNKLSDLQLLQRADAGLTALRKPTLEAALPPNQWPPQ